MNGTSEEEAKSNLANLDLAYLISYAVFMFVSGWVAERMDLRYFLSGGCRSLLILVFKKKSFQPLKQQKDTLFLDFFLFILTSYI